MRIVPPGLRDARNEPKVRPTVFPARGLSSERSDTRAPALRDIDRIWYSRSFMRLAGVTQIASPNPANPTAHNRLTHSLKVAQMARSICDSIIVHSDAAERRRLNELGGIDSDVAMAAGLAHDIGHPPFGHAGEAALDQMHAQGRLNVVDGFEGNTQTFRIATKVADDGAGLQLTAATRAALLKYPWGRPQSVGLGSAPSRTDKFRMSKFGYYTTEQSEFDSARLNQLP